MAGEGKKNPDELGALWIKHSERGDYMTGTVAGQPVVIFRNTRKTEGSNQPDWRVLKSKPQDGRATSSPARSRTAPTPDPEW